VARSAASLVVGVGEFRRLNKIISSIGLLDLFVILGPLNVPEELPGLMNPLGRALIRDFEAQHEGHLSISTSADKQSFNFDAGSQYFLSALDK
jgi:hypothetical protein